MAWTSAFAVMTGESVIATQRPFHVHFRLHWNNAVPDRKSILYSYELKILSRIASFQANMKWAWKALSSNYRFTSLKKYFNNKHSVH